jgi:hypothetical protein
MVGDSGRMRPAAIKGALRRPTAALDRRSPLERQNIGLEGFESLQNKWLFVV